MAVHPAVSGNFRRAAGLLLRGAGGSEHDVAGANDGDDAVLLGEIDVLQDAIIGDSLAAHDGHGLRAEAAELRKARDPCGIDAEGAGELDDGGAAR